MAVNYNKVSSVLKTASDGMTELKDRVHYAFGIVIGGHGIPAGKTGYVPGKVPRVDLKFDPIRQLSGLAGQYSTAMAELNKATDTDKKSKGYKENMANADAIRADLISLGKNMAQATTEGTLDYASGLKHQVARGGKRFPVLPFPGTAVGYAVGDVQTEVTRAKQDVGYIKNSLGGAGIDILSKQDNEYMGQLETRLNRISEDLRKGGSRYQSKVDKKTAEKARKKHDKEMGSFRSTLSRSGL